MKRTLAVVLLAGLPAAWAVDLNAPVTTTPTLGSEIRRGADAASARAEFEHVRRGEDLKYNHCIFDVGHTADQKVADPDPFDLGLFFAAWHSLDSLFVTVLSGAPELAPSAHESARSMYVVFHHLQEKLGVTDTQLLEATGRTSGLKPRLEF
jgi:hypothetical protein